MATEDQTPIIVPPVALPTDGLAPIPDDAALPTVVVDNTEPPPLGRSWAFDYEAERFKRSQGVPLETRGTATLIGWIDKCLHTSRGVLPIHPPEYGLRDPQAVFGRPVSELSAQQLEEDFREALTFHPRIADVTNLMLATDPQSSHAYVKYIVVQDPPTDDASLLTVRTSLEA